MAPGARALTSAFTRYERDRLAFATSVNDAARVEGNTASLLGLGAPRLLLTLVADSSDAVAHTAAAALGCLAGNSSEVAATLITSGVVETLLSRMAEQSGEHNVGAKRAVMAMVAALTRHSASLSSDVAEQGGLAAAVSCLQGSDGEAKEAAVWTLAHLAAHSEALAEAVVRAEGLPPLVACLMGPTIAASDAVVRRVAASTLSDIAQHSAQLAAAVVAAGAVQAIAASLRQTLSNDARLKRQLLCATMNICKAQPSLAEKVVDAGLVADIGRCLKFPDDTVRRHAAACLRDIACHNDSLAAAVTDEPGVLDALATYAAASTSAPALPALLCFGFLAGHSAELAAKVAAAPGAVTAEVAALQCGDEPCQAAAAWALGRMGGWTPALAEAAATGLSRLCTLAGMAPEGSDLKGKCIKAASSVVAQLSDMEKLASLLMQPALMPQLLELLLARCSAVMCKYPATRAAFATSGALAWLEARAEANASTSQHMEACLRLFPEELINHYSPSRASKLLAALSIDPPSPDAIPAVSAPQETALAVQDTAPSTGELVSAARELTTKAEKGGEQAPACALLQQQDSQHNSDVDVYGLDPSVKECQPPATAMADQQFMEDAALEAAEVVAEQGNAQEADETQLVGTAEAGQGQAGDGMSKAEAMEAVVEMAVQHIMGEEDLLQDINQTIQMAVDQVAVEVMAVYEMEALEEMAGQEEAVQEQKAAVDEPPAKDDKEAEQAGTPLELHTAGDSPGSAAGLEAEQSGSGTTCAVHAEVPEVEVEASPLAEAGMAAAGAEAVSEEVGEGEKHPAALQTQAKEPEAAVEETGSEAAALDAQEAAVTEAESAAAEPEAGASEEVQVDAAKVVKEAEGAQPEAAQEAAQDAAAEKAEPQPAPEEEPASAVAEEAETPEERTKVGSQRASEVQCEQQAGEEVADEQAVGLDEACQPKPADAGVGPVADPDAVEEQEKAKEQKATGPDGDSATEEFEAAAAEVAAVPAVSTCAAECTEAGGEKSSGSSW